MKFSHGILVKNNRKLIYDVTTFSSNFLFEPLAFAHGTPDEFSTKNSVQT